MKFDVGILADEPVPSIVRQVQLAESLGFDTAWIADTHLVCRELWATIAACAVGTSRIRIGPGVTVPHTRHISVTASAAVTVSELAPDRVVVGIGTGDSSAGTLGLSMEKMARIATIEQMTRSLRSLMASESIVLETGHAAHIEWLDGPQRIPLYIGASGPKMLHAAGRLGDGVIMYSSTSPSILRVALQRVGEGAAASVRQLSDLDIVIWAPMSIAHDGALARDHARGRVASALRHPLPVPLGEADAMIAKKVREEYDFFQHATAAAKHRMLVPDHLVDLLALAGRPEELVERIQAIEEIGAIRRIAILPQVGGKDFMKRDDILRMFADEVMGRVA
jgi:5,10-methylenetetrahydromethanopterin reductase